MNNLNEIFNINKKKLIIVICIVILMGIGIIIYLENCQYTNISRIEILNEIERDINENTENIQQNNSNEIGQENAVESNNVTQNQMEEEKIAIHITGEVNKTGIFYLKKGARIADAIEAAGGATKNAGLDKVNLAYILEDGQKIYIPSKEEKIEKNAYIISNSGENVLVEEGKNSTNTQNGNNSVKGVNSKVNINSANQTELETLPGIGPSLARRIIEYRESNGKFQKIEDIQNVKGIGDSKYGNIKENICI